MIKKIFKKILAHDYKFIQDNQNPIVITKKMWRIANRYHKLRPIYDKVCNIENGIRKFFYLLKNKDYTVPIIIGTRINKNWERQGMSSEWEWKNTRINRLLNHSNFF